MKVEPGEAYAMIALSVGMSVVLTLLLLAYALRSGGDRLCVRGPHDERLCVVVEQRGNY